jgi:hypothetical protein
MDCGTGKFSPTKEQLQVIYEMVADSIVRGETAFSDEAKLKYNTPELIRSKYVPGMVSNWLRKDTRLNGGEVYVTKDPGSRAGQGDEVLKNLKALRATLTESAHIAAVDSEIESRKLVLAAAKVKSVEVDLAKIPESLRAKLGL